jgi:hypothetical protein
MKKITRTAVMIAALPLLAVAAKAAASEAAAAFPTEIVQKYRADSPAAMRNIRNFVWFQQELAVRGDTSRLEEVMAPQMIVHSAGDDSLHQWATGEKRGTRTMERDMFRRVGVFKTLAGHRRVIEEIYGIGDMVVAKWRLEGKVEGHLFGFKGNNEVSFHEIGFIRFDDQGRMVEGTFLIDAPEFLNSLGVPAPKE